MELATRPEFAREGPRGEDAFFRYLHDDRPLGATRWLINAAGYSVALTALPTEVRLFGEVQHHLVRRERGPPSLEAVALFGRAGFWSGSIGLRLLLGGGPMRMGSYGVLDPMTAMEEGLHGS